MIVGVILCSRSLKQEGLEGVASKSYRVFSL